MERTKCAPWGLEGGNNGKVGRIEVHRDGCPPFILTKAEMALQPGDRVCVFTAGGGGYGDPAEREPQRLLDDVLNGYVSAQAAASEYGVALGEKTNHQRVPI
jgi:N-methylhydantoinase B